MAAVYSKVSFFNHLDGGYELECDLHSYIVEELEEGQTIFISGERGYGKSSWARSFFPTHSVVTDFEHIWKASSDLILDDFDPEEYVNHDWPAVRDFFAFGRIHGIANDGAIIIVSDIVLDDFIDVLVKIFGTQRADSEFVDQVNERITEICIDQFWSLGAKNASEEVLAMDIDGINGLETLQPMGDREDASDLVLSARESLSPDAVEPIDVNGPDEAPLSPVRTNEVDDTANETGTDFDYPEFDLMLYFILIGDDGLEE